MTNAAPQSTILSHELIDACGERAAAYDRENRFFTEVFDALRAAGYLNVLVPRDSSVRASSACGTDCTGQGVASDIKEPLPNSR